MKEKRAIESESERERERERIEEVIFSLPFTSFRRLKLDRPGVKVAIKIKLKGKLTKVLYACMVHGKGIGFCL